MSINNKMTKKLTQTIYLGADHGGFELKETLKKWLIEEDCQVKDMGATTLDPQDDYPQYAVAVAKAVSLHTNSYGILLCRSGGGMTIAANKINGIRAVELFDEKSAKHAREHNHANVITIGADWQNFTSAKNIISKFFTTLPSQDERHLRRIQQISQLEK